MLIKKCMAFHTSQKYIKLLQLSMENVKYFKFLGILFDESLTWECHINMVTNKISQVIGLLNRLKHVSRKMHCYQYIVLFSLPI